MSIQVGQEVTSVCPLCGQEGTRTAYDVGSGPELSCANCEWCWGANGQDLKPLTLADVAKALGVAHDGTSNITISGLHGRSHLLDQSKESAE